MTQQFLDPIWREILSDLFRQYVLNGGKLDADSYRADHEDWIEQLNQLEWQNYLKREGNNYRLALMSLLGLDNDDVKKQLNQCEKAFNVLRAHYKNAETRKTKKLIRDLARDIGLSYAQTVQTVRCLLDVTSLWHGGSSTDLESEETSYVIPGENIITNKNFDDFVSKIQKWSPPRVLPALEMSKSDSVSTNSSNPALKPGDAPRISAFISYSTKDKIYGAQVKKIFEEYGVECFLAHEDLEVSEEWKMRILEELQKCSIFVPLLSKVFRGSDWAPQEIGVIAGRKDVAIIPLSIDGTMPFGFISHLQGKRIPAEGITQDLVFPPLTKKHPHMIIPAMIRKVAAAGGYRIAETAMKSLVPLFSVLNDEELDQLVTASIKNDQVWSASLCREEYLPELIEMHRIRIESKKLTALEYQVKNNHWYEGPE